jgi:hypothetical protein
VPEDANGAIKQLPEEKPAAAIPLTTIQDFIFSRELSEVYLLFDHISGQSTKTLQTAGETPLAKEGTAPVVGQLTPNWIADVCRIGWPPTGTPVQRADQAATLLLAKDRLNAAAWPANGATIAFTILVTGGEDNATRKDKLLPRANKERQGAIGGTPLPGEGGWGDPPPSRYTLAAFAYPGLIHTAERFRRHIKLIIVLLAIWLLFTCALSWNIAAGHAILSRIDALAKPRADIAAKIDAADQEELRRETSTAQDHVAPQSPPAAEGAAVMPYCERHRRPAGQGAPQHQFDTIATLRLCDPADSNALAFRVSYSDLADWLAVWSWVKWLPHHVICWGNCLASDPKIEPPLTPNATDEQWASILAEVLANAVLPVFYGILGAGAAVVRNMWAKMEASLLSPRDVTLALGQLALGAVVGACIGLFVTPNAASSGSPALTGAVSLSASALSFIAGFGVEAVFVALEGLIKRVFSPSASPGK